MTSAVVKAYRQSRTRLLLLDYDGTISDLAPTPPQAKPSAELRALLARLAHDKHNTVVVISGRDPATLESWLGDLGVYLVGEHGYFSKTPDGTWIEAVAIDTAWKQPFRAILQASTTKVPGAFLEDKTTSLAWHYRAAEEASLAQELPRLVANLRALVANQPLTLLEGNKVLEVKLNGCTKGTAAAQWLAAASWDFVLAAGDDTTDEDLFAALPASAYGIKVGPGVSRAAHRLPDPTALRKLLDLLAQDVVESKHE